MSTNVQLMTDDDDDNDYVFINKFFLSPLLIIP